MEEQLFSDKKDLAKELNVCFNNVAADLTKITQHLIIPSFYILFSKHEVHNLSVIKDKKKNKKKHLMQISHLFWTLNIYSTLMELIIL